MSKQRRRYTDEYKREAIKLCQSGALMAEVARDLGIDASMLRRWVQEQRSVAVEMNWSKPQRADAAAEVQRLQMELRKITLERDILKKALGYFAKDPQ
jgi:transposase